MQGTPQRSERAVAPFSQRRQVGLTVEVLSNYYEVTTMSANYRFTAYEGQEGDEWIGLYYVPIDATDNEIGPHRPGTGMILFATPDRVRFTSVYGERPIFSVRDFKEMMLVALPIMQAEMV